jgi:hypothetical protein
VRTRFGAVCTTRSSHSVTPRVLCVTLNYDLLLDSALERYDGEEFADIDAYISTGRKWSLVKPHGSVNWARILENCPKYGDGRFRAPSDLKEAPVSVAESKSFGGTGISHDFYVPRNSEEGYFYPEVVVPVEREKVFVCPASHTALADEFVRQCGNFLLIGFSARDEDLLRLLKPYVHTLQYCEHRCYAQNGRMSVWP